MSQISLNDSVQMQVLKAESCLCLMSELVSVLSCISEAVKKGCCQWISQSGYGSSDRPKGKHIHAHHNVIYIFVPSHNVTV